MTEDKSKRIILTKEDIELFLNKTPELFKKALGIQVVLQDLKKKLPDAKKGLEAARINYETKKTMYGKLLEEIDKENSNLAGEIVNRINEINDGSKQKV